MGEAQCLSSPIKLFLLSTSCCRQQAHFTHRIKANTGLQNHLILHFSTKTKRRPKELTQSPVGGVRQEAGWAIRKKLTLGAAKYEVRRSGACRLGRWKRLWATDKPPQRDSWSQQAPRESSAGEDLLSQMICVGEWAREVRTPQKKHRWAILKWLW